MFWGSAGITDLNPRFMAVITKNTKNTGRMTMDFVADLSIDSLGLLERVFFLSSADSPYSDQ